MGLFEYILNGLIHLLLVLGLDVMLFLLLLIVVGRCWNPHRMIQIVRITDLFVIKVCRLFRILTYKVFGNRLPEKTMIILLFLLLCIIRIVVDRFILK